MKRTLINFKAVLGLVLISLLMFTSCSEDLPGAMDTSDKFSQLHSIKIVNAGENGDMVLQGTIDQDRKEISFPRIEPETNFSALRFEVEVSEGAGLEREVYSIPFEAGENEKSIVLKVVNSPRSTEYFARLRLKVPPTGADFTRGVTYDYSNNPLGNPMYTKFTGNIVRGSGFNGKYVLVVNRTAPPPGNADMPELLDVNELKNNVTNPIPLTPPPGGVDGGTFRTHSGQIVGDHIYIASLSSADAASPLRIYHWADPAQPGQLLHTDYNASHRFGDNMSVNLNSEGNGYIFFIANAGISIQRFTVTNFTTISNSTVLTPPITSVGIWGSFNQIPGTQSYIHTGHQAPIRIVDESANISYTLANTVFTVPEPTRAQRLSDVRVIYFNHERYLMGTTAAPNSGTESVLFIYDITRGDNITQALDFFAAREDRTPLFQYSLNAVSVDAPSTQTAWHVVKNNEGEDEALMIYTATTNGGFAFFEFPKKLAED